MPKYAAVWIDHKEARIYRIHADRIEEISVTAPRQITHYKHPKGPEGVREQPEDAKKFFNDVGKALAGTEAILIVGPSTAKLEFLRYAHRHDHGLEARIVGVETVDHPTDGQLITYTRKYFKLSERAT